MNANTASLSFPETFFAGMIALSCVTLIATFAVMMLTPLTKRLQNRSAETEFISSGKVTLIYKQERCIRILEDGEDYKPEKDEKAQVIDMRDRYLPLGPHGCNTSDGVKIIVSPCIIWGISNIRNFVMSAPQAEEGQQMTVRMAVLPALSHAVAGSTFKQITCNMDEVMFKAHVEADAWLKRYGLALHRVSVLSFQPPEQQQPGKPEGYKEAERLSTLDGVVPKIDEKTLYYVHRMKEAEQASARGNQSEKKS